MNEELSVNNFVGTSEIWHGGREKCHATTQNVRFTNRPQVDPNAFHPELHAKQTKTTRNKTTPIDIK